ncbi:MAG: GNAT family N-acetyltransferase [Sterolibacterium sp.]
MTPGLREHKQASLRLAVPTGLPEDMRSGIREVLDVASTNPRKGHATALMHEVCAEADKHGCVLLLTPRAFSEGMSTEQLSKWYARFGFEVVQTEPETLMARQCTGALDAQKRWANG